MKIELKGCNNLQEKERIEDGLPKQSGGREALIDYLESVVRTKKWSLINRQQHLLLGGPNLWCYLEGKRFRTNSYKEIHKPRYTKNGELVITINCHDTGCKFNKNHQQGLRKKDVMIRQGSFIRLRRNNDS